MKWAISIICVILVINFYLIGELSRLRHDTHLDCVQMEALNSRLELLQSKIDRIKSDELKRVGEELIIASDNSAKAICLLKISDTGAILEASPGVEWLLGYASPEIIGKDIGIFMTEELRLIHVARLQATLAGKILCNREVEVLNKIGDAVLAILTIVGIDNYYIVTLKEG